MDTSAENVQQSLIKELDKNFMNFFDERRNKEFVQPWKSLVKNCHEKGVKTENLKNFFHATMDEKEFELTTTAMQNLISLMNLYMQRQEHRKAVAIKSAILNVIGEPSELHVRKPVYFLPSQVLFSLICWNYLSPDTCNECLLLLQKGRKA